MIRPIISTAPALRVTFRCQVCGQVDAYEDFRAEPMHCARPMRMLQHRFVGGDPNRTELQLLVLDREFSPCGFLVTNRPWPKHWDPAYELWCFRNGRIGGERIGWLGQGLVAWDFIMSPGCSPADGIAIDKDAAVSTMWGIISK